ncbi:MAG TPA: signal peptide peptidase SppA [Candidatus Dormibacteraeota bacterium]
MLWSRPVTLIRIEGTIGVGVRASDWVPIIDGLRRRRRTKAVVMEVDSRGGSASVSDSMHESVRRLAEVKPVVAFTGNLCASGGYLIACAARRFVVQPAALIGSIGVISVRPLAYGLMERVGVAVNVTKSHDLKDMGAFYREPTETEIRKEQALVDDYYAMFLERVEAARKIAPERLRELATGEVFTGRQAVAAGLADQLGTFEDAIEAAAELAGVKIRTRWTGPRRSLRSRLLGPFATGLGVELEERLLDRSGPEILYR